MSEDRPSELAYDADDEDDGMCNLISLNLNCQLLVHWIMSYLYIV